MKIAKPGIDSVKKVRETATDLELWLLTATKTKTDTANVDIVKTIEVLISSIETNMAVVKSSLKL
jgi:hypothetical protein